MRVLSTVCIALVAFAIGLITYHPVANAMSLVVMAACKSANACTGATNSGHGPGLFGISVQGFGVQGETQSISGTGVYGYEPSSVGMGNGVMGQTANHGAGIYGEATGLYGTAIYGTAPNGADVIQGWGSNFDEFYVDANTNIHTNGLIYTGGSCSSGCIRRAQQSYGTSAASPTIEDTGEAQLSFGAVYVRLHPDFANVIDAHKAYVVFLQPEGDTRGLFVTQRSASGFLVRETMGGRSNIAFAYRVVANPYGVNAPRLPFVERRIPLAPH